MSPTCSCKIYFFSHAGVFILNLITTTQKNYAIDCSYGYSNSEYSSPKTELSALATDKFHPFNCTIFVHWGHCLVTTRQEQ